MNTSNFGGTCLNACFILEIENDIKYGTGSLHSNYRQTSSILVPIDLNITTSLHVVQIHDYLPLTSSPYKRDWEHKILL
jgi:hypothetical protein